MIKAKELRIGNCVKHSEEGVLEIASLKHKSCTCFNTDRHFRHIKYEDIEAIQLSPEILEEYGFEKTDRHRYGLEANGFWITVYHDEVSLGIRDSRRRCEHIKYLHQLQNLYFYFSDEELEIKSIQLTVS